MDGVLHIAIPHCTLNVTGNASLQAPSLPHGIAHLGTRLAYLAGQNVTLLHVTCYNKHLPYVRTFFRKPEFGGCKKYIVYIIYILYILYIFYKPILRNMEPPYCNM